MPIRVTLKHFVDIPSHYLWDGVKGKYIWEGQEFEIFPPTGYVLGVCEEDRSVVQVKMDGSDDYHYYRVEDLYEVEEKRFISTTLAFKELKLDA